MKDEEKVTSFLENSLNLKNQLKGAKITLFDEELTLQLLHVPYQSLLVVL
jgi:hypothetical protein